MRMNQGSVVLQIFLDESGTFIGSEPGSISVVGALIVPDEKMRSLKNKYEKVRRHLPLENGEVKGRRLNEDQINRVIEMLAHNSVIFEASVIDTGLHSSTQILDFRQAHAEFQRERIPKFRIETQESLRHLTDQIETMPANLYAQYHTTLDLLSNVLAHMPTYFAQRFPRDLGNFTWMIDGKDKRKTTAWETWLQAYMLGSLSAHSRSFPTYTVEDLDYGPFEKFSMRASDGRAGVDLALLFEDIRFSTDIQHGLEWVDVLTNATRRALIGNLGFSAWQNIPSLMIHRRDGCLSFFAIGGDSTHVVVPYDAIPYGKVAQHFRKGGRSMLTKRRSDSA